jgi:hypothetical protein
MTKMLEKAIAEVLELSMVRIDSKASKPRVAR